MFDNMFDIMQMIGASFVLVIGMMIVLWLIYMVKKNAGIVDIGWSLGFALCGLIYFFLGGGFWVRRWLITGMVLIWSLRLASYLFKRFRLTEEDSRYQEIKQAWGEKNLDFKVLAMFLVQGVLVVILSMVFLVVNRNPVRDSNAWEFVGFFVWLIGVLGESLADWQLSRFKREKENNSEVCRTGLWRFSRHPNYFFEAVVWVGFFIFALGTPGGWITVYCPLLMLYLLLKVSGVPLAEAQSLRSKGEAYREYQRTTSEFFPWFPKK